MRHLLILHICFFPIVTDPEQAAPVLRWVVQEMEERYEKMAKCGVRNIGDYNTCIFLRRQAIRTAGRRNMR